MRTWGFATTARNTSVARFKTGRPSGATGWSTFSQATPNKTPMLSDSIGRYDTSGCHSTTGETWRKFKTSPPNGFGLAIMIDRTWPWADSPLSSDWPWLHKVSNSETPAKGEDYHSN